MSMTKDMWFEEVERIQGDFGFDRITLEQGINRLVRLGFDGDEAETLLREGAA